MVEQPHTEKSIEHTGGQQNTGNHKQPLAKDAGGADRFGGTRAGAENVENGENAGKKKPDASHAADGKKSGGEQG